ncbi:LuxR family transcriptional regulator [Kribbella antibiotica]|uniref:LuxR family transcriptional regulator n=1 Tax=Kribbella antibiotica TaxID=190195 RepID=A0A4R4ZPN7_9ACTN|nr:helix-turn-helix transcriptional regulator [Kribbella antibiotica]TDD60665.1 LuxR family transcriptional regulator [Kribbella antibiotica]
MVLVSAGSARPNVSPSVAIVLYEAFKKMSGSLVGNHYALYDYARVVMTKIAPVDAFYVGLIHAGTRVRFPYNYDGARHDDSDVHTIGRDGLTAWLLANKRTYRFDFDHGFLLNGGIGFGDVHKRSADAVTVPLLSRTLDGSEVFGMMSMQSYEPGVYSGEAVAAFEWIAEVIGRVLAREQEDRDALGVLNSGTGDALGDDFLTSDQMVEYLVEQIGAVRRRAEQVLDDAGMTVDRARGVLADVTTDCLRIQAELVEMTLLVDDRPTLRFNTLTPAEQTIAVLLADGLSNQAISEQLRPTSINTVKTHLKNIAGKYGMSTRAEIAADVVKHLGLVH